MRPWRHSGRPSLFRARVPLLRSRPLAYELTGVCSSVAIPSLGGARRGPGTHLLLAGPNRAPRLSYPSRGAQHPRRSRAGRRLPIRQTGRRVTEVLDLLAMWALLQVLFVWCFARAGGLRAFELEECGYEGEIKPVDTPPQPGCTASPYIRSNPDSTKKDNLENLDAC